MLAVEVHQTDPTSSDLYFDLALQTAPNADRTPEINALARLVVETYHKQHYLRPGISISNGYLDGGRQMQVNVNFQAHSGREILRVDRTRDPTLARDLAFARGLGLRKLTVEERIRRISVRVDRESTPPGGAVWLESTVNPLETEYEDKPILIGEWLDQAHAGVCRHRALLFKILADEAGLPTALTRGNYQSSPGKEGFPHVWKEVALDDGVRVIVDVMHDGSLPRLRESTDPDVVEHYRKVDDSPWYQPRPNCPVLLTCRPQSPVSDSPPDRGRSA